MTAHSSYKITHGWGNPREPEYRNGLLVSSACYKEGSLHLYFKIVGNRLLHSQEVRWILEVPPNARQVLGERWSERYVVFKRVTDYLERLDTCDDPLMAERKYVGLAVDISNVPGWLPTKLKAVNKRLAPLSARLPSIRVFLLFLLGLAIATIDWLPNEITAMTLFSIGVVLLALLIREMRDSYQLIQFCCSLAARSKKSDSWRRQTVKTFVNAMGTRIATSLGLAALLLYEAWNVA